MSGLLCISCVMCLSAIGTDDEVVGLLAASLEKQHEKYCGLKFVYTMKSRVGKGPFVTSNNVLKTIASDQPNSSRRWRYWEQQVQDTRGEWRMQHYSVTDGRKAQAFWYKDPNEESFNMGAVWPQADFLEFQRNPFDTTLFLRLDGVPRFLDPEGRIDATPQRRFKLEAKRQLDGQEVFVLKGTSDSRFGVNYEVHVTAPPDSLVVLSRMTKPESGAVLAEWEVTSLKKYGSVMYPASGKYSETAVENIEGAEAEFSVVSVERVTENDRKNWFPGWPKGTAINDHVNNTVRTIPLDIKELNRKELLQMRDQAKQEKSRGGSRRTWLVVLNIFLFGVIVGVAVWRRARRNRTS